MGDHPIGRRGALHRHECRLRRIELPGQGHRRRCRRAVPGTRVSINSSARPDRRSYRVDFSLWRGLAPDHQPRHSLDASIALIRDGLKLIDFADRDFRNSSLIRLQVLDRLMAARKLDAELRWAAQVVTADTRTA